MDAFYQKLIALSVLMNIVVACDTQEKLAADTETNANTVKIVQHDIKIDANKSQKTCQRLMSSCPLNAK